MLRRSLPVFVMKKILFSLVLAMTGSFAARAQLFSHESFLGAGLGAIAGGIIGHNTGRHGGEGAAIGAGAGFLLGSLIHADRHDRGYYYDSYQPSYHSGYYSYGVRHHRPYFHGIHRRSYLYYEPVLPASVYYAPVNEIVVQAAPAEPSPQPVPLIQKRQPGTAGAMAGANALFGR